MKTETIAAIATAVSNGGISIIRVSGSEALDVVDKIYITKGGNRRIKEYDSHTIHLGNIEDQGMLIDEVLVSVFKGPNSYTAEDVVEINCHGGVLVTKKILELCLKNGARSAEPGEFTKRAFLNGRIDLSQAEAVMDLINAKSDYALKSSVNQLKGNIHDKVVSIRKQLILDVAFIEAVLDDPEHYEFGSYQDELKSRLIDQVKELNKLLNTADNGRFVREGIQTVIVGKPNAGKSSLLNLLVGSEKAIVTNIEGTTRDIIEESIQIDGVCLNIIDTAGIRDTENVVEKIGVEKAIEYIDRADLVLYVMDGSRELNENDRSIMEKIKNKNAIILLNKTDLTQVVKESEVRQLINKPVFAISAKCEEGLEEVRKCIKEMFFQGDLSFNDQVYITNARHKEALSDAVKSLNQVLQSIEDGMPEDFLSIDLMSAYEKLGEIIGESVGEDLINTIFKEFCMGK
ncbi:tRNA uridine-5-carboxymethylaminomethyl(34) synthesis GTPase MnmE [[Clostridium] polysaccharolyticum]|uniref:tRNA modification GTPase MnmE n=1 Tax=[Clostridium] polysaccharolyticum TaxID=29364 RepID=A0A1I0F1X7_9FIRM|nr:tRNA uridine-5-carboxymethylaminomethyl(34) synthesis GTPase MnmE [[Clostridium] polysaccharolyticum]SET51800.1 tRNA modification GTPase [[Clostridium] polysaccharolyticum]